MSTATAPRLKTRYRNEVVAHLSNEFGFKNKMQIPTLTKVVVNMGVGEAAKDSKLIEGAVRDLTTITGQKPVVTKAKKAIAGFKIRQGYPIGAMVTLRGARMYEFLDRFVTVALPRVRDFRGISGKAFDGRGNYNIGIKEQIIFLKSNTTKLMLSVVSILVLRRLLKPTKKQKLCWLHSNSLSAIKRLTWQNYP